MIGETLSHFRILGKLGEGGMGVVYRAEDERLGRNVALKVLQPGAVGNEERRLRFIREARTAASISHPNIAAIHEIDETAAGTVFIAMELVEGQTLAEVLDAGALGLREALRFAIEIAEALGRAHELGIVHRDLKPDNVMVRQDRHLKILDFGLAKLREAQQTPPSRTTPHDKTLSMNFTRDGRVMGTANYMSPEQARGLAVDPRSDLFAFGTLLYEMVTGRRPFEADNMTDTLSAITRDAPVPPTEIDPSIPAELERLILKCLEKDPKDRYQHADDIAVDLRRLRRESDSQSMTTGRIPAAIHVPPAQRRSASRGRAIWVSLGIVALVGALVGLRELVADPSRAGTGSEVRSIAVMPIENLADSADGSQLGRILQELIITDLSGIDALRVFSSQRLYDLRKQIPGGDLERIDGSVATRVATEAGASAMLTGSLSQLDSRWILNVQLVELEDGAVTKSERIAGSDLYEMVDELTARIRDDLGVDQGVTLTSVREKTTESIEAWKAYVDGAEQLDRDNREEAVRSLERAVEIDPTFGQAYIKLAVAKWWSQEQNNYGVSSGAKAQDVLTKLLSGGIKLSPRERQLAQALEPLVAFDFRTAKPLFERLVEQHPDDKEAWYGLGEAIRHGPGGVRDVEALAAFERALELDPTFGVAYVHVEEHYRSRRAYDEAIGKVRTLIERTHDAPEWNFVLARWLLRQGRPDEALALATKAAERTEPPEARVDALLSLAGTFAFEHDELEGSRSLIELALEQDVPSREAHVSFALGQSASLVEDFPAAERGFRRALEVDPRMQRALYGLFSTLWATQRYGDALDEVRERLAESDQRLLYHFWILTAASAGDTAERDRAIEQATKTAKTDDERRWVLLSAADGALEIGDPVSAGKWLDRAEAFEAAPNDMEIVTRRTGCAREQGDHAAAMSYIEQTLDKYPDEPEFLLEVAGIQLEQRQYDAAERQARRVLEMTPRNSAAWTTIVAARLLSGASEVSEVMDEALEVLTLPLERIHFYREVAIAYEAANRWQHAEELAQKAVDQDSRRHHDVALRTLAFAQAQQGRHDQALETIADAVRERPFDMKLGMLHAWILLQAGKPAEAEGLLRERLERGPQHRAVHETLAYALAAQGDYRAAEKEARRAVAMARTRPATTSLAWVLVEGDLDLDEGTALAEQARTLPESLGEQVAPAFQAQPEHVLGLAYMKRGEWARAVPLLEQASTARPYRRRTHEDLAQARAHL